jgi:hypothetical protein
MTGVTMGEFLVKHFLPTIFTAGVGVFGWFSVQFFGRQIVKFYDTRAEAVEAVYFSANVGFIDFESNKARYEKVHDELRRCAAKFDAIRHNATPVTSWFLNWRGYDLDKAVKGLTGLSNSLAEKGNARIFAQLTIEKGLKLQPSHTKEEIEQMRLPAERAES